MQNATTEDAENETVETISKAAQSFDRERRTNSIHSSKQPQYSLISKTPTVGHTVTRQNIKDSYQVNFTRLPKMTALASIDKTGNSNVKSENRNTFNREDPPHSTSSETFNGRGKGVQSNSIDEHIDNKDHGARDDRKTEKLENIEDTRSDKPPLRDRSEKFERWHEFKPHKVEHRMFTSECTVQLSGNSREVPKIVVDKSADPNIKKFLSELITDRSTFDKAVKEGITETKTTTSVVRRTIITNTSKQSETPSNETEQVLQSDDVDKANTVLTSQTEKILEEQNGSEIYKETLTSSTQESKNDVSSDGKTTVKTVINTEDVHIAKIETSNKTPTTVTKDNELESSTKAKTMSPNFLTVDSQKMQRPSDVARRSSFVQTDNFASPEFIKEDLSEEEEEDVFSGKKLPPQSDIFKRSSVDDDDEDLLVNAELNKGSKVNMLQRLCRGIIYITQHPTTYVIRICTLHIIVFKYLQCVSNVSKRNLVVVLN